MLKLRLYRSGCLLLAIVCGLLSFHLLPAKGGSFATAPDVAWASPDQKALNNLGPVQLTSDERRYDCTHLTYRFRGDLSKTMHNGCFVRAAFGLFDQDQGVIILNGTDEAETVRYGGQPAAVSILPYSDSAARFGGFPGLGSYMYLYTHFSTSLEDSGTPLTGQWKDLTGLPNFTVSSPDGQPLAVNPLALAYSSQGQWMVSESPNHALVRVNLATYSVLPFDEPFELSLNDYSSHEASMAVTEDGRYVAVANNQTRALRVYDLKSCAAATGDDLLAPQSCQSHDYWSYVKGQVTGELQRLSHLSFTTDDVLSLQTTTSTGTDSYLLSPKGSITSLIPYLSLGDSFASGQGAFDYTSGTDTTVNRCHLSAKSYPLLLNGDVFGGQGHSVACSGAVIHDVGSQSTQYTGQTSDQRSALSRQADGSEVNILHDFTPGYLAQHNFVTSYQPGVITLQVGGDDVGFGSLLLRCLSPVQDQRQQPINPNNCYQSYEDRLEVAQAINRTYNDWVQLYGELRAKSPGSRIYVIGYPQIVSLNDDCRLNVPLTANEVQFSHDIINYLNGTIAKAARAAGVRYVDVSNAFQGHELCSGASGDLAMNGVTAGTDKLSVLGQESIHPNVFGHQLLEQAILQATHNLKDSLPSAQPDQPAPSVADSEPLLQAPKSGRAVTTLITSNNMASSQVSRNSSLTINLNSDTGSQPNKPYVVKVGDQTAGTIQSDSQGNLHGTLGIPGTAITGIQPITITGQGPNSTTITVIQIVYIEVSSTDSDGDGVLNAQDSCPLEANSGIDADRDGIDDVCDNTITLPADTTLPPTIPVATTPQTTDNPTSTITPQDGSPGQTTNLPQTTPIDVLPANTSLPVANPALSQSTLNLAATDSGLVILRAAEGWLSAGQGGMSVRQSLTMRSIKLAADSSKSTTLAQQKARHVGVSTALGKIRLSLVPLPKFLWYVWLAIILSLLLLSTVGRVSSRRARKFR